MNICRQCFREKSQDIGFHKVRDMACAIEDYHPQPSNHDERKDIWKNKQQNTLGWGVQMEKERTLSLTHMFYQTTVPLNQIPTGNSCSRTSLRPRRSVTTLGNKRKGHRFDSLGIPTGKQIWNNKSCWRKIMHGCRCWQLLKVSCRTLFSFLPIHTWIEMRNFSGIYYLGSLYLFLPPQLHTRWSMTERFNEHMLFALWCWSVVPRNDLGRTSCTLGRFQVVKTLCRLF